MVTSARGGRGRTITRVPRPGAGKPQAPRMANSAAAAVKVWRQRSGGIGRIGSDRNCEKSGVQRFSGGRSGRRAPVWCELGHVSIHGPDPPLARTSCSPGSRSSLPSSSARRQLFGQKPKQALTVVSRQARPVRQRTSASPARVTVVFSEPMVSSGSYPQSSHGPVLQDPAGDRRHVPVVGHHDPHLHAGPEGRAPVLDALHGHDRRLGDGGQRPHAGRAVTRFSFTTPTVKLLATNWYRRGDRFDGPVVIGLRFNQPVRAAQILLQRLALAYKTARLDAAGDVRRGPRPDAGDRPGRPRRLRGQGRRRRPRPRTSTARVVVSSTATWDVRTGSGKPDPTLVVLQTTTVPPTESWIELDGPHRACAASRATSPTPRPQTYTMELEPTFFVDEPPCLDRSAIPIAGTRCACAARR